MVSYIIGIDPGKQGGIAVLKGGELDKLIKCPVIGPTKEMEYDDVEMSNLIGQYRDKDTMIYIEKVTTLPTDGRRSAFTLGVGYGIWRGIFATHKMPYSLVQPQSWKSKMLFGTDKSKKASIICAKRYFPNADLKPGRKIKDDHNLAEALLIAVYGGMLHWH